MRRFQTCLAGLLAFTALLGSTRLASADGETISVQLDQAKLYRIAAPANTIIIGNPGIADATLQDAQTLIITGHTYGKTNMIILDEQGETVSEAEINVDAPTDKYVTVYRSVARSTLSCEPNCQGVVLPGDDPTHFGTSLSQSGAHNSLGQQSNGATMAVEGNQQAATGTTSTTHSEGTSPATPAQ